MQRPHRRAHLRLWVFLTLLVGSLFVLGVLLRQERPIETQRIQQTSWGETDFRDFGGRV